MEINAAIAEHIPMVEAAAREFKMARGLGAEFDDLRQMGLIHVWRSLEAGQAPTPESVERAITRYLKRRRRSFDRLIPGSAN